MLKHQHARAEESFSSPASMQTQAIMARHADWGYWCSAVAPCRVCIEHLASLQNNLQDFTCRYATANYAIGWAVASSLQGPYTKPGGPWLSSINTNANGDVRPPTCLISAVAIVCLPAATPGLNNSVLWLVTSCHRGRSLLVPTARQVWSFWS